MEKVRRRPITAEIKSLKLGDSVAFPIEMYGSVNAVVSRLRKELAREHWDVKLHERKSMFQYVVTRVH